MKKGNSRAGRTLESHIAEKMSRPAFRKAWKAADEEFEILDSLIMARENLGLTQAELAKKLGTKQSALSRLERGGYKTATVDTLVRAANALGFRLEISLKPKRDKAA